MNCYLNITMNMNKQKQANQFNIAIEMLSCN